MACFSSKGDITRLVALALARTCAARARYLMWRDAGAVASCWYFAERIPGDVRTSGFCRGWNLYLPSPSSLCWCAQPLPFYLAACRHCCRLTGWRNRARGSLTCEPLSGGGWGPVARTGGTMASRLVSLAALPLWAGAFWHLSVATAAALHERQNTCARGWRSIWAALARCTLTLCSCPIRATRISTWDAAAAGGAAREHRFGTQDKTTLLALRPAPSTHFPALLRGTEHFSGTAFRAPGLLLSHRGSAH